MVGVTRFRDPQQLLADLGAKPSSFGDLDFDVVLREAPDMTWDVTDYKVEAGYSASDLRVQRPVRVTLDVVFVNKSYGVIDLIANTLTGEGLAPQTWRDKYDALKQAVSIDEPQPLVIGLDSYSDMVVDHVGIVREAKTAGYLMFSVSFKKIIIVDTEFVNIDTSLMPKDAEETAPIKKKKKKPPKSTKPAKKEATPQQKKSILASLLG